MAFGFMSCNNNADSPELKKEYSDEEIRNAVRFVGQGVLPQQVRVHYSPDFGITFRWRIARASRDCIDGIGLCNPEIVRRPSYFLDYVACPNTVYLSFQSIDDFNNWVIELAEVPSIDMNAVRFIVDEDVYVRDAESGAVHAVVRANEYVFDRTVGTAGGFRLTSEVLNP